MVAGKRTGTPSLFVFAYLIFCRSIRFRHDFQGYEGLDQVTAAVQLQAANSALEPVGTAIPFDMSGARGFVTVVPGFRVFDHRIAATRRVGGDRGTHAGAAVCRHPIDDSRRHPWGPSALNPGPRLPHSVIMTSLDPDALLIESAMPCYDAVIAEHLVVEADAATTFAAASAIDLMTVHSPLLDLSMWLRALPARLSGEAGPPLPRLVIGPDMGLPGWTFLGLRAEREIAFGAVGRFWQPTIDWRNVAATDFPSFDEPGWGKIAASFSVRPYGASSSLLTYECRTVTTDPDSRRRFLRYWFLVRPFVGHVLRATLRQIAANATASTLRAAAPTGSQK